MKIWTLRLLACLGGGCLLFLACANFDIWPLAYIGFLPPLLAIRGLTPRRAFFWGWVCGTMASAGGFYWITHLLMRFGHIPWLPSFALFLLMVSYQGLHFGLWAYLLRRILRGAPDLPMTLLAPVVMTALELLMPFIFPWYLSITQAWVVPVIQIADLTGPLGITFLLMMVNGLIYDLALVRLERRPFPRRPLLAGVAVVAAVLVYGGLRIWQQEARWQQAPKVKIGMVQANVGIVEKGRARLAPVHLKLHQDVSRDLVRRGAELLVWPESSYPYAFRREMTRDWPEGSHLRANRDLGVPLIFGTLTISSDPAEKYPYNTALMIEPDGRITGRFDKNFLLVFGEYIPFYDKFPRFKEWFPAASNFARGTEVTTFPFRKYRLGPMICYEDIIPDFGRRLARLRPHLLVNITNDAWFGATSEPYEHMALSVYRAVELRTGLVRSVNTGVTAVIDATGRVLAQTRAVDPALEPGVGPDSLLYDVAMLEGGHTVYAAVGDLFGYLCLAGTLALLLWSWRRGRARQKTAPAPRKPRRKRRR
jgi:apolipoprotein N-acyltransferase